MKHEKIKEFRFTLAEIEKEFKHILNKRGNYKKMGVTKQLVLHYKQKGLQSHEKMLDCIENAISSG